MPQSGSFVPIAPGWMVQGICILSLFTEVYAAGMATVGRDIRRFCGHTLSRRACSS